VLIRIKEAAMVVVVAVVVGIAVCLLICLDGYDWGFVCVIDHLNDILFLSWHHSNETTGGRGGRDGGRGGGR